MEEERSQQNTASIDDFTYEEIDIVDSTGSVKIDFDDEA